MYQQFIEPSKRHADIIVPKGGKTELPLIWLKRKLMNY